jgi:chloramphenicol 3-O phosphotransferase
MMVRAVDAVPQGGLEMGEESRVRASGAGVSCPGTIIMLNGASSSGKTSTLRALQELMPEPYLDAGIDKFIWMLPKRYLDRPLWDEVLGLNTRAGPVGHALFSGMHHAIAALSRAGNPVVADHVLVEPRWVEECARLFVGLPAFLVGIRCPIEVLEKREKQRNDRTWGQAREQFEAVHSHVVYDLEVDTSVSTPQECAQQIKARLMAGEPPQAFRWLAEGRRGH